MLKELRHSEDDRKDTLIKTEEETSHAGGKSSSHYQSITKHISKALRVVSNECRVRNRLLLTITSNGVRQGLTICYISGCVWMKLDTKVIETRDGVPVGSMSMFGLVTPGAAAILAEEHMFTVYCVIVDVYCVGSRRIIAGKFVINNDMVKERFFKKGMLRC